GPHRRHGPHGARGTHRSPRRRLPPIERRWVAQCIEAYRWDGDRHTRRALTLRSRLLSIASSRPAAPANALAVRPIRIARSARLRSPVFLASSREATSTQHVAVTTSGDCRGTTEGSGALDGADRDPYRHHRQRHQNERSRPRPRPRAIVGSRAFSGQFAIGQFQAAIWRFRYSSLTSFGVL